MWFRKLAPFIRGTIYTFIIVVKSLLPSSLLLLIPLLVIDFGQTSANGVPVV